MKKMNKSSLSTQKGFTLIELVVVIVILGILAATAAPKFIDLTSDAQKATIKGVRGAVESATSMIHAKALVNGTTTDAVDLTAAGGTAKIYEGWPTIDTATWNLILSISADDFLTKTTGTTSVNSSAATIIWYPFRSPDYADYAAAVAGECYVSYVESDASTSRPVITVVDSGC